MVVPLDEEEEDDDDDDDDGGDGTGVIVIPSMPPWCMCPSSMRSEPVLIAMLWFGECNKLSIEY
jgi:hypothetical protein